MNNPLHALNVICLPSSSSTEGIQNPFYYALRTLTWTDLAKSWRRCIRRRPPVHALEISSIRCPALDFRQHDGLCLRAQLRHVLLRAPPPDRGAGLLDRH